jgi:hypothetical protein
MLKYGLEKSCEYCGNKFITKPRYVQYCSTLCKNPLNRGEYDPWNKGIKLTEEQKAKQNRTGLAKGHGWNKGVPNDRQKEKWLTNNPNKNGRLNKLRPKNPVTEPLKIYRGLVRKATYRTIKEMKQAGEWVPKVGIVVQPEKHMAYSEKVIDHYENPRNVGKMEIDDTVGYRHGWCASLR